MNRPPGPASLFRELDDGRYQPTLHSRGPWDHGLLHGGPVCGLAAHVAQAEVGADELLLCSRLTVDLLRMVPLAPILGRARVVKPGRRSRVIDVELEVDGQVVARASSQWVVHRDEPSVPMATYDPAPPHRPSEAVDPGASDLDYPRPGFNCDAAELRSVTGSTEESGPGTMWARLTAGVVEGHPTTPLVMAATLSDLAAAVGWQYSPSGTAFVNPDVTMQLAREPLGDWVGLEARNRTAAHHVGFNDCLLWDDQGCFGRVVQTLVESPITLASGPGPS